MHAQTPERAYSLPKIIFGLNTYGEPRTAIMEMLYDDPPTLKSMFQRFTQGKFLIFHSIIRLVDSCAQEK
jgi:hypothetical protein